MFINYSSHCGITINSFRNTSGFANSDVKGLVEDILAENDGSCPLEGSRSALQDGTLWNDTFFTQDVLEAIHAAIDDYEFELK